MPNIGLEFKARNKGETKLSSPCRQNQIIRSISCQNASHQECINVKQPFLLYGEPDLCNDYMFKDPDNIDLFVLSFLLAVSSNKFLLILICSTMWFCGKKLYDQLRNQGV